eukprot:m51a1_g3182 hypothetical protein (358) ;mRNA; r:417089-418462
MQRRTDAPAGAPERQQRGSALAHAEELAVSGVRDARNAVTRGDLPAAARLLRTAASRIRPSMGQRWQGNRAQWIAQAGRMEALAARQRAGRQAAAQRTRLQAAAPQQQPPEEQQTGLAQQVAACMAEHQALFESIAAQAQSRQQQGSVAAQPAQQAAAAPGQRAAQLLGGSKPADVVLPEPQPCSVCLEQFAPEGQRCPYFLRCGHSFCASCVEVLAGASPTGVIRCPSCREEVDLLSSPPRKNFQLADIMATLGALQTTAKALSEQDSESEVEWWRLIVSNIPWCVDEGALADVFHEAQFYPRVVEIAHTADGRSAGYGFAWFDFEAEAFRACQHLNGTVLSGRKLVMMFDGALTY